MFDNEQQGRIRRSARLAVLGTLLCRGCAAFQVTGSPQLICHGLPSDRIAASYAEKVAPIRCPESLRAVARQGSLRRAAEELCLSVSAISHQLKSLERFLGVRLFDRTNNNLSLTAAGRPYMEDVAKALDLIATATARTESERSTSQLAISLFPSLAVLWLLPNLPTFYERAPHIEVSVVISTEPSSFRSGQAEIAIRYESIEDLAPHSNVLFRERMYPVCSARYAAAIGLDNPAFSFENVVFIHCRTVPGEWQEWFAGLGGLRPPPGRIISVDNRALALQAAESGLGIAMGRTPFTHHALREGRLRRASNRMVVTGHAYTVCLSDSAVRNSTVKEFTRWLMEAAAESGD